MSDNTLIIEQASPIETIGEVLEDTVVVLDRSVTSVVETETEITLMIETRDVEILEVTTQGPPGPPGTGGASTYAKRADIVDESLIYKALAAPGSADDAPVWAISKVTITEGLVVETWAGGTALFSYVWNDRASLAYS